ncbi:hypothetical protein [Cytophaga sp. FL35]|uniref:Ig-like domain-containing protein n=1 Tax=Cytophaga sp. FL35 TaxID=1904456 RepID=UPI001653822D|nr:hypothetical protein [Cytophaga sp. FL35]MBC6997988.1 hypothetical protein [Cytophaga sp. FL35]
MTTFRRNAINLAMLCIALLLSMACSKDTDLLADYVAQDSELASLTGNVFLRDVYRYTGETMVLDVLANDVISTPEKVKIIDTSQPQNGTVVINEDKTLTYTPEVIDSRTGTEPENTEPQTEEPQTTSEEASQSADEPASQNEETNTETDTTEGKTTETFTYTTETENEDGSTEINETEVTITDEAPQELKAFPTAEGFGKYTTGGRGGKVIHVTNLNDSGPGSLREAVENTYGKRTVVFDVAGDIFLSGPLYLGSSNASLNAKRENITVAGETAPSPGITLRNYGFEVYSSNVIITHLAIRPHNDGQDLDCIRLRNWGVNGYIQENVMLAHLSLSGGDDENVDFAGARSSAPLKNVTIQNCLIAKGTGKYNFLFGQYVQNASILENVMSHEQSRSVFFGFGFDGETAEMINNITHANRGYTNVAWGNNVDVIGNIYSSSSQNPPIYRAISYEASTYNNPDAKESEGSIFVSHNFQVGNNWGSLPIYQDNITNYGKSNRVITNSLVDSWETTVSGVENKVLPIVGAYLHRDVIDTNLIAEYKAGTGTEAKITPPLKPSTSRSASYDTDGDGIADAWESNIGGTVGVDDSKGDHDGNGYTNIEEFLHYLVQGK